jgi:large subunit ribosomal protein L11
MAKKEPRSEVVKMIKKELKIDTAKITEEDKAAGKTVVADGKLDKIVEIAKQRMDKTSAKDLKGAVKTILGTVNSMNGVLIEGKRPKEIAKEIEEKKLSLPSS